MLYLTGVVICYCLFLLYDINGVKWKSTVLNLAFFVACAGLLALTVFACIEDFAGLNIMRLISGGILAFLFLALLVYTLFLALPFEKTYVDRTGEEQKRKVYKSGVYGLCRHPGVLWYGGFYFSLCLAFGGWRLLVVAAAGTVLDILYVAFQDAWTFPRLFCNYEGYQREVPFLMPTRSSIKLCFEGLKKKRVA